MAANEKAHQRTYVLRQKRHRYRIHYYIVSSMDFHGHGKPTVCVNREDDVGEGRHYVETISSTINTFKSQRCI